MLNIVSGRTPLRRVLQTTVAVALVGGVVAGIGVAPVVATPERVLQSVSISLGNDSSIRSVSSTAVHATEGDRLSSDDTSFDPAEVAEELPVRVLTTYRMGDRTGTDLSEIEGESGRVVIDVTVQNVTARPEKLSYDFNGTQHRTNALVATPLTVVASADLGESGLGSVVTRDDVNPDDVTNGVLGRSGGTGDVQWAALLAPPRLGASATFRLVQETDDFRVPTFDLSVQPGLVTDPSVQHLLEAAFADDPSSTLKLETATIELVSEVNATLTGATSVLAQIQDALSTSADELGQKTIADLQSSSQLVSSALTGLAGDLDSLNTQMASEMASASADTVAQFRDTVETMKTLLGDPSQFENLPTVKSVACGEDLPELSPKGSITEQMIAINAQLRTITTATGDCKEEITSGLNAAIGTMEDDSEDDTVLGSIEATRAGLADQVAALDAKREELQSHFDETLLAKFGASAVDVSVLADAVRRAARNLNGDSDNPDDVFDLNQALDEMDAKLVRMQGELDQLQQDAQAIDDEAAAALATLPPDAESDEIVQAVTDQAAELCALAPADANDPARRDYDAISAALVGTNCDGTEPTGTPAAESVIQQITGRTLDARSALTQIASLADAARLAAVDTDAQGVRDLITRVQEDPKLPGKGKLRTLLSAVFALADGEKPNFPGTDQVWPGPQAMIEDLAPGEAPSAADCERLQAFQLPDTPTDADGNPAPPEGWVEPDSLELMLLFYAKMACNQDGINESIDAAFEAGKAVLEATGQSLEGDKQRIDGARDTAKQKVDEMVDTLTTALTDSAASIRSQGKASVTAQRSQLDREQARLTVSLDRRVEDAVHRIGSTVGDSTRNLAASEKALLADLNEVLIDLGDRSRSGSGLLGALVKGAADTGTATDSVIRANRTASEFAGVRSTALEDVYLQQAQLSRSLELLEAYPAFGIDLPEGSSHLTVFTFTIGES